MHILKPLRKPCFETLNLSAKLKILRNLKIFKMFYATKAENYLFLKYFLNFHFLSTAQWGAMVPDKCMTRFMTLKIIYPRWFLSYSKISTSLCWGYLNNRYFHDLRFFLISSNWTEMQNMVKNVIYFISHVWSIFLSHLVVIWEAEIIYFSKNSM